MITEKDRQRYDRQILIRGFGEEGQEKLKKAKVFLAGAGGLGSPAAYYLAAAGVGTLVVTDRDVVDFSNLNRQILHWEENIGRTKAKSAKTKLSRLNPDINIVAVTESIEEDNAADLVGDADVIVDAMDNLPTRYLLNKVALSKGIPFVHGAVSGFEGRAMTVLPGQTACLNCLYHGVEMPKVKFPVIGVTPGVIGCIEATEAIKYIVGLGDLLAGRLLNYDGLSMKFSEFAINRDPNCAVCKDVKGKAKGK